MVIILWKSNIITTLYVCDVINYLCTITELTVDFWFHTGDERTVHLFILLRRIMSLFILILFTSSLTATTITTSSQGFHLEMNVSIVCNELLLQVTCVDVFLMRTAEILSVCMQTCLCYTSSSPVIDSSVLRTEWTQIWRDKRKWASCSFRDRVPVLSQQLHCKTSITSERAFVVSARRALFCSVWELQMSECHFHLACLWIQYALNLQRLAHSILSLPHTYCTHSPDPWTP